MTLRVCIYKNCEKFINLRDRSLNKDVKLFGFPKDPERRKKWIEYGKVPPGIPPSMYYFCGEHFDRKFMAVNNRRTVLVGEAVPFPYVEPEIDENYQVDSNIDYYLYDDSQPADNQETLSEQELHVESTTAQDDDNYGDQKDCSSIKLSDTDSGTNLLLKPESKEPVENSKRFKRIYDDIIMMGPSSSKIIKISASIKPQQKSLEKTNIKTRPIVYSKGLPLGSKETVDSLKEDIEEEHFSIDLNDLDLNSNTPIIEIEKDLCHNSPKISLEDGTQTQKSQNIMERKKSIEILQRDMEEIDEETLIDEKHVTTFVYKGEEHVQMSKDYYVQEKMENAKNLKKMRHIVKTLKEYFNSLDV